jgi:tRNA G18 (ribose-2'-O)-methylase SpoU
MAAPEWRLLVELLKRLATPSGRTVTGQFSLEGYRSMERALRNDAPVEEVLVSERFAASTASRECKLMEEIQGRELPLRIAPDDVVRELARLSQLDELKV